MQDCVLQGRIFPTWHKLRATELHYPGIHRHQNHRQTSKMTSKDYNSPQEGQQDLFTAFTTSLASEKQQLTESHLCSRAACAAIE